LLPPFETAVKNISVQDTWSLLKKYRNHYQITRNSIWLIVIACLATLVYILFLTPADPTEQDKDYSLEFILALVILIAAPYFGRKLKRLMFRRYSTQYKDAVISQMMDNMIKNATYPKELSGNNHCEYQSSEWIQPETLERSPLFEKLKYNVHKGEDWFKGTLGLTDFECSEVTLTYEYLDDYFIPNKDLKYKGFVFMADFHKSFEGTTIVRTRKGKTCSSIITFVGSPIQTVSYEFDKMFDVFTTDEVTARYLLPINMLERLMELRKRFNKYGISICLHGGIITILIHYCDFFEVNKKGRLNERALRKTYDELKLVLEIIDVLNLNTRIWGKQENAL
jgi:hypothetical protein